MSDTSTMFIFTNHLFFKLKLGYSVFSDVCWAMCVFQQSLSSILVGMTCK